ncbi:MAG: transcription elongation factor GreA [Candidatus Delongbacteria bacterium]|nr:transcription elongation factor GreA [Candidatus Delongbacteria bacterium]
MGTHYITRKGYERLHEQLAELRAEQPLVRDRIAVARELGDLSENAEYHAAREEMTMLMYKIDSLEAKINSCRIVEEEEIDISSVRFFTKVTLMDLKQKKEKVFKLVSAEDMDIASGRISIQSPLAKGLIGKKVGGRPRSPYPQASSSSRS